MGLVAETVLPKETSRAMTKPYSIASVTVATNAARFLPRQLDALRRQTRKIDEIIVVDNASSDDTLKLLASDYPEVTVLNLPKNGGVGGAFSAGLAYTTTVKKHDWTWLLDDDSVPSAEALEKLLAGLQRLGEDAENTAILAPMAVHKETQLAYPGYFWRNGLRPPRAGAAKEEISFVDIVISSGTLIRKEAIERVGLPRADFFMDCVDIELCLRLRRNGYRIAVVTDCRFDHAIGDPRRVNLFGFHRSWADHAPWREYYITRNELFTIWTYYPDWKTKSSIVRRLLRHAAGVVLFGKHKMSCLRMMYHGFVDGRAGRLGIRFLPDHMNGYSTEPRAGK
jgi:rhamnopyranosyl-N-acetylglucosaminyl-diphospho-decaprenol beta-1,3/1,4-galactofuranosyltransferase